VSEDTRVDRFTFIGIPLDKAKPVVEKVLERPPLIIGPDSGNIWLLRGSIGVLIKLVKVTDSRHRIGMSWPRNLFRDPEIEYTGPIDDEMMANILIYGG
jgi:hypothetical protein